MAINLLNRLAAAAPCPVFACAGPDMLMAVEKVLTGGAVRRVQSPRSAAILLVAGDMPDRAAQALDRIHDQIPPPRETVHWDGTGDPAPDVNAAWSRLLRSGAGEPDRCPDTPPNPWKGEGDHGQGGTGMMGGTPYGRPMAMTGVDPRDGLELDRYTMCIGPFAPMLPPGLELELTLQGDLIASARVLNPPFRQSSEASAPSACAARLLRLLGLGSQADRLLRRGVACASLAPRALPQGLGDATAGQDVRKRLREWLDGQPGEYQAPEIGPMLEGLEWHEAMLVLNSWPPDAIRRAAQVAA